MPPDEPTPDATVTGVARARDREWSELILLAITVLLVVTGLILLAIGYGRGSMTVLYASIGCTAVAGVVLILFGRLNRRRAVAVAAGGAGGVWPPAPAPEVPETELPDAEPPESQPAEGVGPSGPASVEPTTDPVRPPDRAPSDPTAATPDPGSTTDQPDDEATQS